MWFVCVIAAVVTSAGLLGGLLGGAFPRIVWADLQARGDATGEIDTSSVFPFGDAMWA